MHIGVPRETKVMEYRVGMVPDTVTSLVRSGHEIWVEQGAGVGSGFCDEDFERAGARIASREEVWSEPDLVVKVKEPVTDEVALMRSGQVLFTYLHLAANRDLTTCLCDADVIALAYETIQNPDGSFPVLAPMSEVAGRLATQIGVGLLQKDRGGKGILLGGVPGVARGRVAVIGAGTVGINAARVAHALGAEVDIFDIDLKRLTYLYDIFHGELSTLYADTASIERSVSQADLVVGAVYVNGRRAPTLVTEDMVSRMTPGSVIVDVAVDQGGCVETIRPTTHADPTYLVHDVIHYGVANMPGAVPQTSTRALANTTLPFIQQIASEGVEAAVCGSPSLGLGANVWCGSLVHEGVADSLGMGVGALPNGR
ncbi:MAG: alanine dehydrogenase [bacterium]|nr:alanine dehydrogenase [Deltaproteobacteria bacterium]MCP4239639.1 alanine dehydrogenase [bacterium]MDP7074688.1 alanine dehydrogenase [Myxococcota bacterium]MDP7297990.1 alanine dehydrogenase [Myxococcota bacterium]HJO23068.1 alanine dehydrogenase [Myxococcota bacterium]